jgi:cobalamin biosynthesis Mg chelatase CobN
LELKQAQVQRELSRKRRLLEIASQHSNTLCDAYDRNEEKAEQSRIKRARVDGVTYGDKEQQALVEEQINKEKERESKQLSAAKMSRLHCQLSRQKEKNDNRAGSTASAASCTSTASTASDASAASCTSTASLLLVLLQILMLLLLQLLLCTNTSQEQMVLFFLQQRDCLER